ncbi:MAG TPA: hypothetical protein VGK67_06045 [Myxococcales bacterium]|jgi:hypothetical protein
MAQAFETQAEFGRRKKPAFGVCRRMPENPTAIDAAAPPPLTVIPIHALLFRMRRSMILEPPSARGDVGLVGMAVWTGAAAALVVAFLLSVVGASSPAMAVAVGGCAATGLAIAALRRAGASWKRACAVGFAPVLLTLACSALAGAFYDISCDGNFYHQDAILRLARGWNPIRDSPIADGSASEFINHYAKGAWTLEAGLYGLFQRLEAAKGPNLLLLVSAGLLAYEALRALGVRRRIAIPGAALLAANPVALYQSLSFYVDGQVGSTVLALLSSLVLVRQRSDRLAELTAAGTAVYLVNIKFTGIAFLGFVGLIGLGAVLPLGRRRVARLALVLGAGALVGVFGVGFNPYVTNTLQAGHPFHPLFGPSRIDIMSTQTHPAFSRASAVEKLGRAHFSRASNSITSFPNLKLPFAITRNELVTYRSSDVRFAGFGPWFGGLLLLALGLGAGLARRPGTRAAFLVVLALALSGIVTPEAWWARYVPYLWLPPVLLAIWAASTDGPRLRPAGLLALVAAGVNALLVLVPYASHQWQEAKDLRRQLRAIAATSGGQPVRLEPAAFVSVDARLAEAGIRFERGPLDCPTPERLHGFPDARLCVPIAPTAITDAAKR